MKKELMTRILLTIFSSFMTVVLNQNTLLANGSYIVTVGNTSCDVNGDTLNLTALIDNPGDDGISFPEAIAAANQTPGAKTITFDTTLIGATITIAVPESNIVLSSGELTIDGDIDEDGNPDITIDGHLMGYGHFIIISDSNKITGLNLVDFPVWTITLDCPYNKKDLVNNQFLNNNISSQTGGGIAVGPLGIIDPEDIEALSNLNWRDILIKGNSITAGKPAVALLIALWGFDNSRLTNVTISDNYLTSTFGMVFDIIVADENSHSYGTPAGPVDYSTHNLIDSLQITGNHIEAAGGFGIHIIAANAGNNHNTIRNLTISDNTFQNNISPCINIHAGGNADNNLIANMEIARNKIIRSAGIYIEVGSQSWGITANHNRIENVRITENEITDYHDAGITLSGACSHSGGVVTDNTLDSIIISDNYMTHTVYSYQYSGILVNGGGAYSNGSALRNKVQGLYILNNQINNVYTGICLTGGVGAGATDNQVFINEIQGNTLTGTPDSIVVNDNLEGAVNNTVIISGKVASPVFSPMPGIYESGIDLSMHCETLQSVIRFTTDGAIPAESSSVYRRPIRIDTTTTVIARAFKNNWIPSDAMEGVYTIHIPVHVENEYTDILPDQYYLSHNYPNPFNPETKIQFEIPETAEVEIIIYNMEGREIRSLLRERREAGHHEVFWDGTDNNNCKVSSGVYLYQLTAGQYVFSRKLIFIK